MRTKLLNGMRAPLTPEEDAARDADEANAPAEQDAARQAEIAALTSQIDQGRSALRSLGVEIYLLAKAVDPTLTPAKFIQRNADRIATF